MDRDAQDRLLDRLRIVFAVLIAVVVLVVMVNMVFPL